jgi:hypothetical protein
MSENTSQRTTGRLFPYIYDSWKESSLDFRAALGHLHSTLIVGPRIQQCPHNFRITVANNWGVWTAKLKAKMQTQRFSLIVGQKSFNLQRL